MKLRAASRSSSFSNATSRSGADPNMAGTITVQSTCPGPARGQLASLFHPDFGQSQAALLARRLTSLGCR